MTIGSTDSTIAASLGRSASFAALAASIVTAGLHAATTLVSDDVPLIPRETLFGNPERANVQISPDGSMIAFLAPSDGVLNVWVMSAAGGEPRPITASVDRPIRNYGWAWNGEQIVFAQDDGGDENTHIFTTDLATGATRDLTPFEGVAASILDSDRDRPDELLVTLNNRDPRLMDVARLNLRTGEMETVVENDGGWISFVPDADWTIRARTRMTPDGGLEAEYRDSPEGEWNELARAGLEDAMTTSPVGFTRDGSTLWMIDSRERETAALVGLAIQPGGSFERETVYADDAGDVSDVMSNPLTGDVEAWAVTTLRKKWRIVDPAVEGDLSALSRVSDGDLEIVSRSGDDRRWIAAFLDDDGPVTYWTWDRDSKEATYLFTNRPALEGLPLVEMRPVMIPARDGLQLPSYVSVPKGASGPVPLVLLVHGGPWARDAWGFNPYHQWLANRGAAVLSVNFRGSTGFGKAFLNAGNREWYHAMQDDLVDAVRWAIKEGIADPDNVAIMGGSYGGYATLAGLTRDPDLFACGIDIVGPSHVRTLLETIPPYWEPVKVMFEKRVGSLEESAWLDEISPLTHVANIVDPLLIGQGANDPRVKISESDQIVEAMKTGEIPVTYVVFPDEGHGFAKPANNMAFNAIVEAFLAKHLGTRSEPIRDSVAKSTAQVRELGGLALPGVERWDPSQAPAEPDDPRVTWDDLSDAEQAEVQVVVDQLEALPPNMLPAVIGQMKSQRAIVPEADMKKFLYLLQELERREAEASAATEDAGG